MSKKLSWPLFLCVLLLALAPPAQSEFQAPAKNLSNSALSSLFPKVAQIPATPYVFVIWVETDGTSDYLYFAKSADSGATWTTPLALVGPGKIRDPWYGNYVNSYAISMAADNPYLHIVMQWRANDSEDFEVYYLRSADLGETWSYWVQLTDNTTDSRFPDVAARAGYVHVTYSDAWPGNEEIMYKRIELNGAGAVYPTRRLTFSGGMSFLPKVAVSKSGAIVNIVYEDDSSGQFNIFYKHIEDYGAGSYETRQLTSGSSFSGNPDIAVSTATDDQYVYIVYEADWPGNREIIFKRLDNYGGAGFTTRTVRLSYSSAESRNAAIAFDGIYETVHIAFQDNWPGNNDVMYRKFGGYAAGGYSSWRVSYGTGDSINSSVDCKGIWALAVWADNTSGNYEIYFKHAYY